MAYEDILARSDSFADAPVDELARITGAARKRVLSRGDHLFEAGEDAESMFIVITGRVAIAIANELDKRESMVALMETGDLFGEMGLLDGGPRSAMARAIEPCEVLEIPYDPVEELLERNPKVLRGVVRMLADRLRVMDGALADSVFLDVTGRTAKRLLELAGDADEFVLPVTQEELAGMVGASRERVNKAISSFIRLGWIEQHERRYKILLRDRLELRSR